MYVVSKISKIGKAAIQITVLWSSQMILTFTLLPLYIA